MKSESRGPDVSVSAKQPGPLILVVEAVEETRDGIEKLLTADGYRVEPAWGEEDAVAKAMRASPDLILVSPTSSSANLIPMARTQRFAGQERQSFDNACPGVQT